MTYTKKILDNSEWVTVDPKEITENGITDTKEVKAVDVNVSGGGGSSDLSTAQVTILIDASQIISNHLDLPNVLRVLEDGTAYIGEQDNVNEEGGVRTIVMYQGKSYISDDTENPVIISTSGNIEPSTEYDGEYIITGDCSITAKLLRLV